MPPAARVSDQTAHGTPLAPGPGSMNVIIGGMSAWRAQMDQHACPAVNISGADGVGMVQKGSLTVFINGMMACRQLDIVMEIPGLAMGPVNPIILGFMTVIIGDAGSPTMASALGLIDMTGSADAMDAALVAGELAKMPQSMLDIMNAQGTRVKVCRGSMTEYRTDLHNVHPRGWPPGATWDTVPGAFTPDRNEVVIAVIGHGAGETPHVPATGEGHGSSNLVIHESTHSIDEATGGANRSTGTDFNNARNADAATLDPYESQAGSAGQEETYAESAARYYGGDTTDEASHPNLHSYWGSDPLTPKP